MILTLAAVLLAFQAYLIITILHSQQERRKRLQDNFISFLMRRSKYQKVS